MTVDDLRRAAPMGSRPLLHLAILLTPAAAYLLGVALAVSSLPDVLDRWDRRLRTRRGGRR
jgi:hypothetical protein